MADASATSDSEGVYEVEYEKDINLAVSHTAVDVLASMIGRLRNLKMDGEAIIHKIPNEIRAGDDRAYEPSIISVGPYHKYADGESDSEKRKLKPALQPMEDVKLLYLDHLCRRHEENTLEKYVVAIQKLERKARKVYSLESVKMSSKDFVEMLVLDGCFIVEFLLKRAEGRLSTTQSVFHLRTKPALRRDLFLFENQIPFFILETVFEHTGAEYSPSDLTVLDLAVHYLYKGRKTTQEMLPEEYWKGEKSEIHHLLHLSHLCLVGQLKSSPSSSSSLEASHGRASEERRFHSCTFVKFMSSLRIGLLYAVVSFFYILLVWKRPGSSWNPFNKRSSIRKDGKKRPPTTIPTATQLKEVGVRFKKKEKSSCYLDVSFKDGKMEIPALNIHENTISEYRNLLAFEQTCLNRNADYINSFTSYLVLMNNLIDTAGDVAILKKENIIKTKLECEDDVATFFKEIPSGLVLNFHDHYFAVMFVEINEYSVDSVNRFLGKVDQWWEELKQKYFRNPWAFISLMAAFILLGLTAAQTTYSIKTFQKTK